MRKKAKRIYYIVKDEKELPIDFFSTVQVESIFLTGEKNTHNLHFHPSSFYAFFRLGCKEATQLCSEAYPPQPPSDDTRSNTGRKRDKQSIFLQFYF